MGRRPLGDVRRTEILDAVQACVVTYGLAGTTMERIAEQAGMHRSAVSYFLGNRDDVIAAAVERSCDHYIGVVETIAEESDDNALVEALIEGLIGGARVDREAMILFDEILTLAHHDSDAHDAIRRAYDTLERRLGQALVAAHPDAPDPDRAAVRHALMHLIDNEERFRALGLTDDEGAALTRQAARALVSTLER